MINRMLKSCLKNNGFSSLQSTEYGTDGDNYLLYEDSSVIASTSLRNESIIERRFRMKKTLLSFVFICVLLIMSNASVSALGITPGRTTLAFEAGQERHFNVTVINSDHTALRLLVQVRGELNGSIVLHETQMTMAADESERNLAFSVRLPTMLSPGLHTGEIVVLQLPDALPDDRAVVATALAVATQIHVQVPYPGSYAEGELKVMGSDSEKRIIAVVRNRGTEPIAHAHATVSVFDDAGKLAATLNTDDRSLNPGDQKDLVAVWTTGNATFGKYSAKAVVEYDGNRLLLETPFELGDFVLDLLNLYVNDFTLGGVAKFNMLVHNKWSQPISQAYTEMRVLDKGFSEVADVKSATYEIPAGKQTTLAYYWDTKGIAEGLYKANILLYYGDKKTQHDLDLDVSAHAIQVIGLGRVISTETSGGSSSKMVTILSVIIGFLILMNVLWFVVLRKRKVARSMGKE